MKLHYTIILLLICFSSCAQQMSLETFNNEALSNIRLLPKYGHRLKTPEQLKADELFIQNALVLDSSRKVASDGLIATGFSYLKSGDLKTAMYRFNQAYLIDSTNTDIFWGYGAVYMTLKDYPKAKEQYLSGLSLAPNNAHILADYGTYLMIQYHTTGATNAMDSAIVSFERSYQIDPKNQNTSFKLSLAYFNKNDCENAWKYYNECLLQGGKTITEDYTKALQKKCKRKK